MDIIFKQDIRTKLKAQYDYYFLLHVSYNYHACGFGLFGNCTGLSGTECLPLNSTLSMVLDLEVIFKYQINELRVYIYFISLVIKGKVIF
jgi:hypothetical protein